MTNHGFPCGNFAISGSLDPDGRLFGQLQVNPGRLGSHLQRFPGGGLGIRRRQHRPPAAMIATHGVALHERDCAVRRVERQWPLSTLELADPQLGLLTIRITAFAPVAAACGGMISAIPCLLARVRVRNRSNESIDDLSLDWQPELDLDASWHHGWYAAGAATSAEWSLQAGEQVERWLVIAHHDGQRLVDADYADAAAIAAACAARADSLLADCRDLERRLPSSGDPTLDAALRWHATAAVFLTKMTSTGDVVTMGYKELNQRDSYWTSFIHLLLWPELDRRMIEQSIAAQLANGKVPTCILPTIDRDVDIDINACFVLRISRHLAQVPDPALARAWWPAVARALAFLDSLDDDGVGLPCQRTFWGDWKDVPGVAERRYAPYACLMVVAARRHAAELAAWMAKPSAAAALRQSADRAMAWIDHPFAEGGLWNGRFYQQRWRDGRDDRVLLQDQVIAALFGVISDERLTSIWDALDAHASTPWGVSETWPWYAADFGYQPGHYHNGGIWPWINHADGWARLVRGRHEDGLALLKRVAWADLEAEGDHQPHEYLSAQDGSNCGPPIQGWTAALVGAVAWGSQGRDLSPHFPAAHPQPTDDSP